MLTVKLAEYGGHEQIYEATEVWASRTKPTGGDEMTVHARLPDDSIKVFSTHGALYVMNERGKTVANYWLGVGSQAAGDQARAPGPTAIAA